MEVDASSSSARTICTIHFTDQLTTRLGDQHLLADAFALDPSATTSDSDLYWSASPVTLSPRLPALPTPSPFLRITTDNKPKDPSCGFLFGSNPTDCDIVLDQTSPKQFAIKVDFKTGEIQLKNHSRTGTLIRYPESAPNNPRVLTQRSLQSAQTVDVVLSPTNFIRICSHGQISNGHLLSPVSPRYSSQNSPDFIPFTNIDMSLDNHESTPFYFPLHPMGVGAQHSVSPVIDNNDMSLDFAQTPEMGLGFSQSSSAYSSGPFQPLGGLWANDIDPNMAPFINENVVDSSPLSQASIEPLQLQNTSPSVANGMDPGASPFINDNVVASSPLSHTSTEPPQLQNASPRVVQSDNNIRMEVNGKQVLFRTAQKQWDMDSILRACSRSQDQHRAFKKKLSRLGRVTREGHRKYISLRDGVLLIRAVGLETQLADMIAMLPESVPPDEENFLLRYQRGPQKNHLIYNNHEIAYKPEAGLIKATDLVKIANVTRRTLFAYFTRFPKMKKEVVKGGAHSGTYILLQDVPTLCRAFNIDLEVYHRLREKFPSSDRGPLTELDVNSSENLASNAEVSMTGEPPPTNGSGTTNPSSPFCEDYFGPDAEFTFHGDENTKPAGDSSSRGGSRSDIPRNRISPIDANAVSQASHGSNANLVSHASFGSLAGYESSGPHTSHSSHASSGSHEFPSSFYRTRGSLVLDLNLEDYTLSRYYDDFTT